MTFKPGQSGNPTGRPKKDREIERLVSELVRGGRKNGKHKIVQRLVDIAIDGRDRDSIKACEILLGYEYGRPRQRTEVTGPDGGPLEVEVAGYRERLASRLASGKDS